MYAGGNGKASGLCKEIKAFGGSFICLFKCMNIDVGRIYGGMTKSFGDSFDVRPMR